MADVRLAPTGAAEVAHVDVAARRTLARRARLLVFVNLIVDLVAVTCGYLLSKGILLSTRGDATSRTPFSLSG
ncbi:MAG: hypothetical protein JOZ04_15340, partial [Acidimicrobiia bacterium]|nr:hypothetical protein [Acidimicrobiia bacterium]